MMGMAAYTRFCSAQPSQGHYFAIVSSRFDGEVPDLPAVSELRSSTQAVEAVCRDLLSPTRSALLPSQRANATWQPLDN